MCKYPQLLLALAALNLTSSSARILEASADIRFEVLPDGNVRDTAPSEKELSDFALRNKANLVFFKAGSFEMGDWGPEVNEGGFPFDGPDSKPLHKVSLDAFFIGKFPVTYAEFDLFTAAMRLPRINQKSTMQSFRKPNNPAGVSWQGAYDYCQWAGQLMGLAGGLPTEAQWEYAARSGGRWLRYPTDNGDVDPGRNLPTHEQARSQGGLVPVDSFPPNPAGLYYLSARVREWTNDWYDANYYANSPSTNPTGPNQGSARVVRGHYGSDTSAMTFKRWSVVPKEKTGTWIQYSNPHTRRDIPHTRYSSIDATVFRCVFKEGGGQAR